MTPVVFGKKEDSCGDFGEVPDTLPIFRGTITIGGGGCCIPVWRRGDEK
jgi:hypothetical protein